MPEGGMHNTGNTHVGALPLHWRDSLQFKLGLLFALLILLGLIAAYSASRVLVRDGLVEETFRYQLESGRRLAVQFDDVAHRTEMTAGILSRLAGGLPNSLSSLRTLTPQIIEHLANSRLIANVGIWPEPNSLDPSRQRASLLWVRDAAGILQLRDDYNDPRTVAYYHEKWYTPARYGQIDRCYWTPAYQATLSRQEVITCTMPIRNGQTFVGVVTLSINIANLAADFAHATENDQGYSLLLDQNDHLLSVSAAAEKIIGSEHPRNLAELGQKQSAYNPLALIVHKQDQDTLSGIARSSLYDSTQISTLQQNTRDMSRPEAEAALSQIWGKLADATGQISEPQRLLISDDPVLGEDGYATAFSLSNSHWRIVRITPSKSGFSGVSYLYTQSLLLNIGATAIILILVFSGLRYILIRPLRHMNAQLAT
ncbi:MAG: cache domain-containing protein, partial [Stenotrophobium sp.]